MLFLRILAAEMKPLAVLVVYVVIAACKQQDAKPANPAPAKEASVTKAVFGTTPAGETVDV